MTEMRSRVLGLYKRVLLMACQWNKISQSKNSAEILNEANYIRQEAKTLFRQNANVTDKNEIMSFIREVESRIELAIHYGTPYPRLTNLPTQTLAPQYHQKQNQPISQLSKRTDRLLRNSVPSYLKSYTHKGSVKGE